MSDGRERRFTAAEIPLFNGGMARIWAPSAENMTNATDAQNLYTNQIGCDRRQYRTGDPWLTPVQMVLLPR
jgi:hypothetical protein